MISRSGCSATSSTNAAHGPSTTLPRISGPSDRATRTPAPSAISAVADPPVVVPDREAVRLRVERRGEPYERAEARHRQEAPLRVGEEEVAVALGALGAERDLLRVLHAHPLDGRHAQAGLRTLPPYTSNRWLAYALCQARNAVRRANVERRVASLRRTAERLRAAGR